MKKLLLIIFFLSFFSFLFVLAREYSNAQTCSGTTPKCRTQVVTSCVTATGASCVRGDPGCNCTETCSGGTRWTCNACSGGTTSASCASISRCDSIDSCLCVESGGCTWTPAPTCTSSNCQIFCDSNCNEYNAYCSNSTTCSKGSTLIASNTSACNGVGGLTCPKVGPTTTTTTTAGCVAGTGSTNASCGPQNTIVSYSLNASGVCCGNSWGCRNDSCTLACHDTNVDPSLCEGTSCQRCNASNICENYTYTGGPTCPTDCSACPGGGGGTCMNTKLKPNPKTG